MRALLLILLAGPAVAQGWEPVTEVQADLDRDGTVETYRIVDGGEGMVGLLVDEGGRERVVPAVAWTGGMDGQRPELSLSEAGSVVLTSMNEAIGRDRWRLSLTVAHREGDWRIAGVTYDWWDTLEPETGWGRCDLNLLSGRGEVAGPAGESAVDLATPAMALWDWREAMVPDVLPAACFG